MLVPGNPLIVGKIPPFLGIEGFWQNFRCSRVQEILEEMACLKWKVTSNVIVCRVRADSLDTISGSMTGLCCGKPLPTLRRILTCEAKYGGGRNVALRAMASPTPGGEEYNSTMKREMMNPYEYHHELGIYYTRITPNLIVGSQPQSTSDIDKLFHDEKVGAILNLQQDKDVQYWGIDLQNMIRRCEELGVWHIRRPARDFDGDALREVLPRAVSALEHSLEGGRTVYVHCTAGLGRAPAVAIAYLFWFNSIKLEEAYSMITSKRPCGPKEVAIRGATYDLAKTDEWKSPFEELPKDAFSDVAQWERQLIQDRVRSLRWT